MHGIPPGRANTAAAPSGKRPRGTTGSQRHSSRDRRQGGDGSAVRRGRETARRAMSTAEGRSREALAQPLRCREQAVATSADGRPGDGVGGRRPSRRCRHLRRTPPRSRRRRELTARHDAAGRTSGTTRSWAPLADGGGTSTRPFTRAGLRSRPFPDRRRVHLGGAAGRAYGCEMAPPCRDGPSNGGGWARCPRLAAGGRLPPIRCVSAGGSKRFRPGVGVYARGAGRSGNAHAAQQVPRGAQSQCAAPGDSGVAGVQV